MLIVREVLPPDGTGKPRTAEIGMLLQAFDVPWLRELGKELHILDDHVYCDGLVVATIEYPRL